MDSADGTEYQTVTCSEEIHWASRTGNSTAMPGTTVTVPPAPAAANRSKVERSK
jgi:hypothetical protein